MATLFIMCSGRTLHVAIQCKLRDVVAKAFVWLICYKQKVFILSASIGCIHKDAYTYMWPSKHAEARLSILDVKMGVYKVLFD